MTPATLNTILNSAPMIIQGATRLIRLIREREGKTEESNETLPATLEELSREVRNLEQRLNDNSGSDVEQIRLIEELARQNESIAETLAQALRRITLLNYIAIMALVFSAAAMVALLLLR